MRARAVLFDLDGTLIDSLADIGHSMNDALAAHGLPPHPLDSYRTFVGEGAEMLVARAVPPERHTAETLRDVAAAYRAEYAVRWHDQTRLYDGIAAALDHLVREGVLLAILSNKPQDFTAQIAARYFGAWPFRSVRGARPGVPKKPDPTAALELAAELGVAPGMIAFVGDTATDMDTARAARMRPVGACWGFRDARELSDHGAEVLVDHPAQLAGAVLALA